jgi:hypothetical protein
MDPTFLKILTVVVLLTVPVVILLVSDTSERKRSRRFDKTYRANLRRRRPDLNL